jgi:site-specific DNA-methyltransferase (adenine-specific)
MIPANSIIRGDCIKVMRSLPDGSADFILTDPPYLVGYRGRDGRSIRNDRNGQWLAPAFEQMARVLKDGGFCVSFYGWNRIELFMEAWKAAGFRPVGHLVFRKRYASSGGFLNYRHEQAYLLGKGELARPDQPIDDVIDWVYTGNRLHPTQKPVECLKPLVDAFCPPGGLVLDPFCGSGSTCAAAQATGRSWIGIELDRVYHRAAARRMARPKAAASLPRAA